MPVLLAGAHGHYIGTPIVWPHEKCPLLALCRRFINEGVKRGPSFRRNTTCCRRITVMLLFVYWMECNISHLGVAGSSSVRKST